MFKDKACAFISLKTEVRLSGFDGTGTSFDKFTVSFYNKLKNGLN